MPFPVSDADTGAIADAVDLAGLESNLSPGQSAIFQWNGRWILMYEFNRTADYAAGGFFLTDISDLPATTIQALQSTSPVASWWDYVPKSAQDVIDAYTSQVNIPPGMSPTAAANAIGNALSNALLAITDSIGKAAGNLTGPLLGNLSPVIIVVGVIALVYLFKGRSGGGGSSYK